MTDSQNFPDFTDITNNQNSLENVDTSGQNSTDSYTDVTETSWGQRLSGSIVGGFFGLILLIGGPWLLWWNEGNEVKALKGLSSAEQSLALVSSTTIDPSLNGRLVYLTGDLVAAAPPVDSLFGLTATGQALLERHVEMYQWQESSHSETEKTIRRRTASSYDLYLR